MWDPQPLMGLPTALSGLFILLIISYGIILYFDEREKEEDE